MSIDELLEKLNIYEEAIENENGSFTIELADSNQFDKFASKLRKSDLLEEDQEASQITDDVVSVQYLSDDSKIEEDFVLTLIANFDVEEYKLVIRKLD